MNVPSLLSPFFCKCVFTLAQKALAALASGVWVSEHETGKTGLIHFLVFSRPLLIGIKVWHNILRAKAGVLRLQMNAILNSKSSSSLDFHHLNMSHCDRGVVVSFLLTFEKSRDPSTGLTFTIQDCDSAEVQSAPDPFPGLQCRPCVFRPVVSSHQGFPCCERMCESYSLLLSDRKSEKKKKTKFLKSLHHCLAWGISQNCPGMGAVTRDEGCADGTGVWSWFTGTERQKFLHCHKCALSEKAEVEETGRGVLYCFQSTAAERLPHKCKALGSFSSISKKKINFL